MPCCLPGARKIDKGFTLLELLVVLVLLSLAIGLAAPAGLRALDAARERGVAVDLQAYLNALPMQAFTSGHALHIDEQKLRAAQADLPADWRLVLTPAALTYGPSGVAAGGVVELQHAKRAPIRWRILPLTGEVQRVEATSK